MSKEVTLSELQSMCGQVARSKGFNLKHHVKQLLLIASEANEALENIIVGENDIPEWLMKIKEDFSNNMNDFEALRKNVNTESYEESVIFDRNNLGEELADIIYRCCSYADENGINLTEHILAKHERNKLRPPMHGKSF